MQPKTLTINQAAQITSQHQDCILARIKVQLTDTRKPSTCDYRWISFCGGTGNSNATTSQKYQRLAQPLIV